MYKPRTRMGREDGRLQDVECSRDDDDDGEDKNNNILVVARANRACLGWQSIIIIEPDPSSALLLVFWTKLGTFQSLAAPPAACRLIFPNTRLIITHPLPPAQGNITCLLFSPSPPCPVLHYYRPPYYSTCPFCPHRRQLVPTPNPLLALATSPVHHASPALRLHYYRRLQTCPPSET
jgi:hypothetical protein